MIWTLQVIYISRLCVSLCTKKRDHTACQSDYMSGKVKKVEFLKKWSSKWGWNILRNVLFFRIFKLHRELENFLGMIYLSCKVIFCPPETHKHARKKIRIIGHILFSKTLKWEGGKHVLFPLVLRNNSNSRRRSIWNTLLEPNFHSKFYLGCHAVRYIF